MKRKIICCFIVLVSAIVATAAPAKYNTLGGLGFTDSQNALYKYLTGEVSLLLEQRARQVAGLTTREDWLNRQEYVRKALAKSIGEFPERNPLNAKVTKVIRRDGYRIELVVFESQPNFFVTASLYIPDKAKKNHGTPALLFCSGHAETGRLSPAYQKQMQNFVQKGFIVLSFDPVGQGERTQYLKEDGIATSVPGPTIQHSYPGTQMLLCGYSASRPMMWDGIRAIDYLLSRKEVDPDRIGVTGRSGGGTQTAMIAALDSRVAACSPENYLTTYNRLFLTMGPQDAEQDIYHFIANGLDQTDLALAMAPKPYLMITTTNDIFNVQGTKEIEQEMKRAWQAMGKRDDFKRTEDYAPHAYTKKNNESNYAFYSKCFGLPCDTLLADQKLLPDSEMYATPNGRVYSSLGGEDLFTLNLKEADRLSRQLDARRKTGRNYYGRVAEEAKALAGYREPKPARPMHLGSTREAAYVVERYATQGEGGYWFPYLIYRPQSPTGEFAVYLNAAGKGDSIAIHDAIEPMLRKGVSVLVPDLVGYGEMGPGALRGDAWIGGVSHNLLYLSCLIGRSILAIRTADLVSLADMIRETEKATRITGVAHGETASILLHAAAFSKSFDRVVLTGDFCSYYSMASQRTYDTHAAMNIVPGALTAYDLPDLAASLAPRPLSAVAAPGNTYRFSTPEQQEKEGRLVWDAYKEAGAADNLQIKERLEDCF